jgi:two-component system nitrogen regulation response regulator GlnG
VNTPGETARVPTIVAIDDDPAVLAVIRRAGGTVVTAETAAAGLAAVADHRPDVVLLDIHLPDRSGLDAYAGVREIDPRVPVVFVTAAGASDTVIRAMQLGAFDYLPKPLDLAAVRAVVARAADTRRLMATPVALGDAGGGADRLVGRSAAMQEVYKTIGRVAGQDVTVLVRGESGTGKELVARAIYQHSKRADRPFLAINCAAIPEPLLESELFGHEKGAFTGADRRRVGRFEQCDGGTLFLDEIGDMPLALQAKMLRVLQEQRFERVGGETVRTDVRIVAATHQDLERQIAAGRFRADLFYRLRVVTVDLPPLRDRPDDLPVLTDHFLGRFRAELGRAPDRLAPEAAAALARYPWPGNVRELEGALKQAVLHAAGPVLLEADLPAFVRAGRPAGAVPAADGFDLAGFVRDRLAAGTDNLAAEVAARVDAVVYAAVMRHTRGNQVAAARALGIARNSLRKRLGQLGLGPSPAAGD